MQPSVGLVIIDFLQFTASLRVLSSCNEIRKGRVTICIRPLHEIEAILTRDPAICNDGRAARNRSISCSGLINSGSHQCAVMKPTKCKRCPSKCSAWLVDQPAFGWLQQPRAFFSRCPSIEANVLNAHSSITIPRSAEIRYLPKVPSTASRSISQPISASLGLYCGPVLQSTTSSFDER